MANLSCSVLVPGKEAMTVWETAGETAGDYLQDTLGDALAEILLDCANNRPQDPLAFVAAALNR